MTTSACQTLIDWAATGSMLQGIGTLAGVAAVVWGAINGAKVWKHQKQAERRFEAAERILTAAYRGRRALAGVRSPMMSGYEQSKAEETLKEDAAAWGRQSADRQKRLVVAQAYLNRLKYSQGEQTALDECLPIARALFGEELEKSVDQLRHQFWVVQVDVESYVDDEGRDPEFSRSIRRGLYATTPRKGEKNEITDAVEAAIQVIERVCQPALRLELPH